MIKKITLKLYAVFFTTISFLCYTVLYANLPETNISGEKADVKIPEETHELLTKQENQIVMPVPFEQSMITEGFALIYKARFNEAIAMFKNIRDRFPNRPEGYLLTSIALSMFNNVYRTTAKREEFYSNADIAVKLAEEFVKKKEGIEKEFHNLYYCGALGYRALEEVRKGSIVSAFFDGVKAINIMKNLRKLNNNFKDIYYGFGMFHYYKYYYGKKIFVIPSKQEDKELGYKYLDIAKQKGYFLRGEALFSYLTVKIYEHETEGLEKEILDYIKYFPDNIFFYHKLIDLYEVTGESQKIPYVAEQSIKILNAEPEAGAASYIKIYLQWAKAELHNRRLSSAHELLIKALSYKGSVENCFNDKNNLSEAKELFEELNQRLCGTAGGS